MPQTINGIGTTYYGKRNQQKRHAVCTSCSREVDLLSYDTRHWFVIFYIPIIPLKKKRIIDQCPLCTMHRAADLDDWETASQLGVAQSLRKYQASPSVESAIETHGCQVSFGEMAAADEFRPQAIVAFPESADLRFAFGSQLEAFGRQDIARKEFEAAIEVDANHEYACGALSRYWISDGKLAQAEQLIQFAMQPGVGLHPQLENIEILMRAYDQKKDHAATLRCAKQLLVEFPKMADFGNYRKLVRRNEKALGLSESLLPKQDRNWYTIFNPKDTRVDANQRTLAYLGLAVALLIVGFLVTNEYIRTHRTFHLLGSAALPLMLTIDDQPPIRLAGKSEVVLAEGKHSLRVSTDQGELEPVEFAIQAGYWSRWFSRPAWVFNPCAAVLQYRVVYTQNPGNAGTPPETVMLEPNVYSFPAIDHPFNDPPERVSTKSTSKVIVKDCLAYQPLTSSQHMKAIKQMRGAEQALRFAENRMRLVPADVALLVEFQDLFDNTKLSGQARDILAAGLNSPNLHFAWHRAYLGLCDNRSQIDVAKSLYDAQLQQNPASAELLYLRGLAAPTVASAVDYFDRAAKADASFAPAIEALAMKDANQANWAEAAAQLATLDAQTKADEKLERVENLIRLATEPRDKLLAEYQQRLGNNPVDTMALLLLIDLLAVEPQSPAIDEALQRWQSAVQGVSNPAAQLTVKILEHYIQAIRQVPLEESVEVCVAMPAELKHIVLCRLLDNGRFADAATLLRASTDILDSDEWLMLTAMTRHAGDANWREYDTDLVKLLQAGTYRDLELLEVWQSASPPAAPEVVQLRLSANLKATLFADLANRFAASADTYRSEAKRFAIGRLPPYQLVEKLLQTAKQ